MNDLSPISYGQLDGFLWIRCEGKGNFLSSPQVKQVAEERIAAGERVVVVDLESCSGMDSTFMGTLAGIARKLIPVGGNLQIAGAGERVRGLLEGLGLDALMEINPPVAAWKGKEETIRQQLQTVGQERLVGVAQARHVLDAHETLGSLSEDNARKFKGVVDCLRDDLDASE